MTVSINSPADCGELVLGDGSSTPTLTGSGTLTLRGSGTFLSGTVSGNGRTLVAPGATLTLHNSGSLYLTSRALENGGTVVCSGGGLLAVGNGLVITNRPGALFDLQNAAAFNYQSGAACRFDNAGTFRKELNPGPTSFSSGVPFNNYGTVDLQAGSLQWNDLLVNSGQVSLATGAAIQMTAGGSASGLFNTASNCLVEWAAASPNTTFTLNPGAQLNGEGLYRIASGTLACNTDVPLYNLDLQGALAGTGTATIGGFMVWNGNMSGAGRTVIAPGATLYATNATSIYLTTRVLENAGTALWAGSGRSCRAAVRSSPTGRAGYSKSRIPQRSSMAGAQLAVSTTQGCSANRSTRAPPLSAAA